MRDDPEFSIIIPAYLEEENLRVLLPRLMSALSGEGLSFEVLVVDTRVPMDSTRAVCAETGATYLARSGGDKYGDAVRTGLKVAKGEFIIFMDADGSHPPEFCLKLIDRRNDGDVVIASRYIEGGTTDNAGSLVLMSRIVNVLYSVILGLDCKDVSNSFKLYRSDLVKSLELHCDNFDIVEEILFKIKKVKNEVRFLEIPFSFKERMFGHTKRNLIVFIFTYFITILRLRFGK